MVASWGIWAAHQRGSLRVVFDEVELIIRGCNALSNTIPTPPLHIFAVTLHASSSPARCRAAAPSPSSIYVRHARDVICGPGTRLCLHAETEYLCRHTRNGPAERTPPDSRQNTMEGA